jgi:luciferase family oxidoreductase group 1
LAAALGLPYAFASHFAPEHMMEAIALYRARFKPADPHGKPYVMLGLNVFAANSDEQAERLYTSQQRAFANLRRGHPGLLPPPVDDISAHLLPHEQENIDRAMACRVVGAPDTVRRGLAAFIARTGADELMIAGNIFDHTARLRSFEIAAAAANDVATHLAETPRQPVLAAAG